LLEEATRLAPQAIAAHLQLARMYEQDNNIDAAIDRYRQVIAAQPRHVAALNNLAYALATQRKAPAEALPLARRAVEAAPGNPAILDTLAWIEFLNGDLANATPRIGQAVRLAPQSAELRLHAAAIYAAAGRKPDADAQLREALKLQPSLETSDEVRQIRRQLDASAAPAQ
jgi:Tfp pilus assembly protein PilF